MLSRPHRPSSGRVRYRITVLTVAATLATAVVQVGPAAAAPDTDTSSKPSKTTTSGQARLSARVTDPELAAKALGVTPEQAAQQEVTCSQTIRGSATAVTPDDRLEETVNVSYTGTVDCPFQLERISGEARALDRTPPALGEVFDGNVLGGGSRIDNAPATSGSSTGSFQASAFTHHGARKVEPVLELFLDGPPGFVWTDCEPPAGLHYLTCDGVGTENLHLLTGAEQLTTGLTTACRNFSANLNVEEARLYQAAPTGTAPASTQMIQRIPAMTAELTSFRRDLCATSTAAAVGFVQQRGQRLWDTATQLARAGAASGDDRPLYWARLGMVVALRQWVPPNALRPDEIDELVRQLEFTSRGMASVSFTGTGKRAFISGFDPFGLDARFGPTAILNSNESGASVLRLDGQSMPGVQVQAVIFPVRYREFDAGLVEAVYGPMLSGGADIAMSISEGVNNSRGDFELEVFNGRNRSTGPDFPDNEDSDPPGTFNAPEPPLVIAAGPQFTTSSLKVDVIDRAAFTAVDRHIWEIRTQGQAPVRSDTGPTAGSTSVEGGGGGFLSNEIAYRVTRLRDTLGSTVPAGHLHVPGGDGSDASRITIATRCASILRVATLA